MKIRELRAELEKFGIDTKQFVEKREMEEALEKARASRGRGGPSSSAPRSAPPSARSTPAPSSSMPSSSAHSYSSCDSNSGMPRRSVRELRAALQKHGIDPSQFVEKSEMERALAKAQGRMGGGSSSHHHRPSAAPAARAPAPAPPPPPPRRAPAPAPPRPAPSSSSSARSPPPAPPSRPSTSSSPSSSSPSASSSMSDFDRAVVRCTPAEVNVMSAANDLTEAQELYGNKLPKALGAAAQIPRGRTAGGAATTIFLGLLYEQQQKGGLNITWPQALKQMQSTFDSLKINKEQCFQLSSSRPITSNKPLEIIPKSNRGTRRAILIGINYRDQGKKALRAPQNDCMNLKDALVRLFGFSPQNMLVLMDDGKHPNPTKSNIMKSFANICRYSQPGDVLFVSFSGHGGQTPNPDEPSGFDSSIMPVDYMTEGQIIDDVILKDLVKSVPEGVYVTMLFDCCHSGSIADLPYSWSARGNKQSVDRGFNLDTPEEMDAKIEAARRAKEAAKQAEYDAKVQNIRDYQDEFNKQPIKVVQSGGPQMIQIKDASGRVIKTVPASEAANMPGVTMQQQPQQMPAGQITIGPDGQPMMNGKPFKLPPGAKLNYGAPQEVPASVMRGKRR